MEVFTRGIGRPAAKISLCQVHPSKSRMAHTGVAFSALPE